MPRTRLLHPGFFTNEILAQLPFEGRLLFQGLWCLADREGRLEDRPKRIGVTIFPYDDGIDVDGLLSRLAALRFIDRYEAEGLHVIQIVNFLSHQKPHLREQPSTLPKKHDLGTPKASLGSGEARPRRPVSVSVSDPVSVSDQEQERRTAAAPPSSASVHHKRTPEEDRRVLGALATDIVRTNAGAGFTDLKEILRQSAAKKQIAFDGRTSGEAIESALARQQKASA